MSESDERYPGATRGVATTENEDLSFHLCQKIACWRYEALPPEVLRTLKLLLLDTLGVTAGAATAPGIRELNGRLHKWESSGSATGLIGKRRYSPPTAALANGAAAHALDFDDQHDPARAHGSCVILPALLAAAEDIGKVSGRDFLLAFAIGAEMEARMGVACYNSLRRGWHPTMVFGTLAASLGAGSLLKLDPEGLRNAFGMAFHQASGSAQSMRDGVLSKRIGPGFAARAAVLSAFLAADGLTGTRRTLEGNAGLFSLYERGEVNADALTGKLGETWHVPGYSFKPWPGCRCNHTTIGLGIGLNRQGVKPGDVARIEIGLGSLNWLTVGAPYDAAQHSVTHAQFNAAYSFARALMDGRVDLRSFDVSTLDEPAVVALTTRTRIVDDPAIDAASQAARVKLTLRDGNTVQARSDVMKGSPEDPMSEDELLAKFRGCLDFGIGASRAESDRLAEAALNIERADDAAAAIVDAFPALR
jgi:2-methylcitrate dehydratase PrpD